jgi:sugar phosphate isomerase/epimerase
MTHFDRRSFLATLGVGALGLIGCSRNPALANAATAVGSRAGTKKLARVGIQLYTVRTRATADLRGTLTELASIGYKEIEWWGRHALTPVQIRDLLAEKGLTAPSVHIGIPRAADGWAPIFDSAKVIGHRWITAASPPFQPRTTEDFKRLAVAFNDAGKVIRDAGFRFAYHNHGEGMREVEGKRPFEILLTETDPALVSYELDVHWAYQGGADAIDLITRYPGRFKMMHIKDSSGAPDFRQANVGAGTYPWAKVIATADRAGFEHYFVEHDSPADPMVFARTSYEYLSKLDF